MPRRRADNLYLKFRLKVLWRMPKSVAVQKLKDAIRTGICPDGIEIEYLDWQNESARGSIREGEIPGSQLDQMRVFYGAMRSGDIRAERAD